MDMFYLEEDQPIEVPAVQSDPYHLRSCDLSKTSESTVPVGIVFNSFCADAPNYHQKKQQNYFENSNPNYFVALKQHNQTGSNGDASSPWRDQSIVNTTKNCENNQRSFYLGADEDEDCDQRRRVSICTSDDEDFEDDRLSYSDEDNVVGFRLDEDSGVGTISNGPSLDDEDKAELIDEPSDLIAVPRSLRFGSVGQRTMRSTKSRKPKLQFTGKLFLSLVKFFAMVVTHTLRA
uniref:Uncharacterized protein n=1 Tax=Panagrolaimus sp. JU765 TaxID=591449 RepID=A0AC34QF03_9BILA